MDDLTSAILADLHRLHSILLRIRKKSCSQPSSLRRQVFRHGQVLSVSLSSGIWAGEELLTFLESSSLGRPSDKSVPPLRT